MQKWGIKKHSGAKIEGGKKKSIDKSVCWIMRMFEWNPSENIQVVHNIQQMRPQRSNKLIKRH